jgi:hypothetical protein
VFTGEVNASNYAPLKKNLQLQPECSVYNYKFFQRIYINLSKTLGARIRGAPGILFVFLFFPVDFG